MDCRISKFLTSLGNLVVARYRIVVASLIIFNLGLAATSVKDKSLTYDETSYIAVGNYIVETGDTEAIVPGSPPLPFFVVGIFWNLLDFNASFWTEFRRAHESGLRSLPLIFESGYDPDLLIFLARLPVILTFPIMGLLIFNWSRQVFGLKAALLALTLAAFSPNLLAHSRLAATDFLAAVTFFGSAYSFRQYLKQPGWKNVLIAGCALGLALMTKYTAAILIPAYFVLLVVLPRADQTSRRTIANPAEYLRSAKFFEKTIGQPRMILSVALMGITALLVIWAGHLFEFRSPYIPAFLESFDQGAYGGMLRYLQEHGIRIPAASYFVNLYHQSIHGRSGHPSFFMGEMSWQGRWYYFPFAFLIKTPVPMLALLLLVSLVSLKRSHREQGEEAFLLVPVALLLAGGIFSDINIGLRHILPVYPFLFVWVSRAANFRLSRCYPLVLSLFIAWYAGSNLHIYPHYLEYFNEFIGGPRNGHKYLVDSNLDWGQDLKLLLKYLKENNIQPKKIVYFGPPWLLNYYGYQNGEADCNRVYGGFVTISVTHLYSLYTYPHCHDWLRKYEPVDRIAYSIFIYKIPPVQNP
ncbi:MAG: phospholipid carrier-dependent glycosyltransferase [Candidatus Abyssubacteria bacterium]